jgi:crossover junction endodeoxyribonuclease RuvC
MRVLGIDPGYDRLGFGCIEFVDNNWELLDCGIITTDSNLCFSERLENIYEDMLVLLKEFEPNIVGIEDLFFKQNITTCLKVAEARGVITLACSQNNLSVFNYKPNEIKLSITGYGKAEKHQIQYMVKTLLNLETTPKPDDTADALAVALTCAFDKIRI